MSIFYSFPGAECGFSFPGKTVGRVPGKTAVRDGTVANDGYFARKISRGSGGGARRRKTGQTGDFCVESAEKKEKMGPWAAKISMEEVSAAEAAKRRGQKNDCVEIRQNKTFHSTMCDIILCLHIIYV